MASLGSLAQSVATTNQANNVRPTGPISSLRSGAEFISYILKDVLGWDPVFIVNASLLFAAFSAFTRWTTNTVYSKAKEWVISTVTIGDDDPLYHIVLRWMADHKLPAQASRAAKVVTVKTSTLEDDENALHLLEKSLGKPADDPDSQLMNYRAMIGRSPIEFQFEKVSHLFRHRGRFFWFKHNRTDRASYRRSDPYNQQFQQDICSLSFECFGRSADPIKNLILDAQTYELAKPQTTVRICRAITNPNIFLTRPARGIDTVILARDKKEALLKDINEYLHPRTRRWYTSHGIPYRRGYLFSGSPGTGKTSLTASLAGLFGLDLYTISLLEPHVNEGSLTNFFFNLQTRCIVLLEDIDAAGLKRDDDDDGMMGSYMMAADIRFKRRRMPTPVSLSGLLNALDGVASQEGRIVIMTTNHPEKLDDALIRPGRVDMHVTFDLPAKPEMADLFVSMYKNLTSVEQIAGAKEHVVIAEDELDKMANKFAALLPECALSLAAIQGYLLKYKDEPQDAVKNAEAWGKFALEDQKRLEEKEREREKKDAKRMAAAKIEAKIAAKRAYESQQEELRKLEEKEEALLKEAADKGDSAAQAYLKTGNEGPSRGQSGEVHGKKKGSTKTETASGTESSTAVETPVPKEVTVPAQAAAPEESTDPAQASDQHERVAAASEKYQPSISISEDSTAVGSEGNRPVETTEASTPAQAGPSQEQEASQPTSS